MRYHGRQSGRIGLAEVPATSYKGSEAQPTDPTAKRDEETMAEFDDMTHSRQQTFVSFVKVCGWSCAIIAVTLLLMALFLL